MAEVSAAGDDLLDLLAYGNRHQAAFLDRLDPYDTHLAALDEGLRVLEGDFVLRAAPGRGFRHHGLQLEDSVARRYAFAAALDTTVAGVHQFLGVGHGYLGRQVRAVYLRLRPERQGLVANPEGRQEAGLLEVALLRWVGGNQRREYGRDDHHHQHDGQGNYGEAAEQPPNAKQLA